MHFELGVDTKSEAHNSGEGLACRQGQGGKGIEGGESLEGQLGRVQPKTGAAHGDVR